MVAKKRAAPAKKKAMAKPKKKTLVQQRRDILLREAKEVTLKYGNTFDVKVPRYSEILSRTRGRPKRFSGPDELLAECIDYFQWAEDNPLLEAKLVSFKGDSALEAVPKLRLMTITMLCVFLGIDETTWRDLRKQEIYSPVCTRVEAIIRTQKLEGAAADMFNPLIVGLDLGLKNKWRAMNEDEDDDGVLEVIYVRAQRPSNSDA